MDLSDKQKRFVEEYLIDLDCVRAYIKAGYKVKKSSARSAANRLLTNVDVAAAVRAAQDKRSERVELTQDWIIDRLIENANRSMQAVPVLSPSGEETGEYRYEGSVANRSLELLGKHKGMFSDKLELSGNLRLGELVRAALNNAITNRRSRSAGSSERDSDTGTFRREGPPELVAASESPQPD